MDVLDGTRAAYCPLCGHELTEPERTYTDDGGDRVEGASSLWCAACGWEEDEAVTEVKSGVLLVALHVPDCDPDTVEADMIADIFVDMINDERRKHGGKRIDIELWPSCQWITTAQTRWLMDAARRHNEEAHEETVEVEEA